MLDLHLGFLDWKEIAISAKGCMQWDLEKLKKFPDCRTAKLGIGLVASS